MKNKVFPTFEEAVADIPDGATIMLHSFSGPGGIAQNLIAALREQGAKDLTLIGCNLGQISGVGVLEYLKDTAQDLPGLTDRLAAPGLYSLILGKAYITPRILIENGQVKKAITSWVGTSIMGIDSPLEKAVKAGEVELDIVPQGTLAERIRAGGAGLGGFYSPVGLHTVYEEGKERRNNHSSFRTGHPRLRTHFDRGRRRPGRLQPDQRRWAVCHPNARDMLF